jgi:hypothetical protein
MQSHLQYFISNRSCENKMNCPGLPAHDPGDHERQELLVILGDDRRR